jgi:hypothetical protein
VSTAVLAALAVATVATVAESAGAQDAPALAHAREQFREAAALQAASDWARALEGYKQVALVRSTAQLRFNIATCEEKLGDYLRAVGSYRLALTEATETNAKDIERAVKTALDALDPRIPTLTLRRGEGAAMAEITLDGRPLGSPSIGVEIRVNPGPHDVRASATNRESATIELTLGDGDHRVIELTLKPRPGAIPANEGAAPEITTPDAAPTDTPAPPRPKAAMRNAGFVIGGAGLASLVASGVLFGYRQSAIAKLDGECGADHMSCPSSAKSTRDQGATFATASTTTFAAGLGALALGGTLVGVSLHGAGPRPAVGFTVTPGGGALVGAF